MNRTSRLTLTLAAVLALGAGAWAQAQTLARTPSTPDAKVYFITPANGATVNGKFTVRFGLANMGVAPAGTAGDGLGHHHLLIDMAQLPPLDQPLPKSDKVMHFGKGQTEVELNLPAGKHTLQLVLADANHIPHMPPVLSEKITVTVLATTTK